MRGNRFELDLPDLSRKGELSQPREFYRVNYWIGISDPEVLNTADALFQRIIIATGGSVELELAKRRQELPANLTPMVANRGMSILRLVEATLPDFFRNVGRINLQARKEEDKVSPTFQAITQPPALPKRLDESCLTTVSVDYRLPDPFLNYLIRLKGRGSQLEIVKNLPGNILQKLVEAVGGTTSPLQSQTNRDGDCTFSFEAKLGDNSASKQGERALLFLAESTFLDKTPLDKLIIDFKVGNTEHTLIK